MVHTHAIHRASLHGAHEVLCCCLTCTLAWVAGVPLRALTETKGGILGLESHNVCRCTVSRTKGAGCIQATDVSIPCSVHISLGLDVYRSTSWGSNVPTNPSLFLVPRRTRYLSTSGRRPDALLAWSMATATATATTKCGSCGNNARRCGPDGPTTASFNANVNAIPELLAPSCVPKPLDSASVALQICRYWDDDFVPSLL